MCISGRGAFHSAAKRDCKVLWSVWKSKCRKRQDYVHDYPYGRDPNSPTSYPRQPMPIVNNPQLYNNSYHGSSDPRVPQTTQMQYAPPTPTQYVPQSPIDGSMQYPASPPRPFACDMCALSFNRQHDLKRHRDTHSGDKPFLCEFCGKTFTRKDALKRHQTVKKCGPLTPQ